MTTSHTPGPWFIARYDSVRAHLSEGDSGKYAPVADCVASRTVNDATRAANARLIAAAPDLLAALERIISSRTFSIDHEENRIVGSERWDLRQAMIQAITKATGGTDR